MFDELSAATHAEGFICRLGKCFYYFINCFFSILSYDAHSNGISINTYSE